MSTSVDDTRRGIVPTQSDAGAQPEHRPMWWEQRMQAHADAGLFSLFANMPRLVVQAMRMGWRVDRWRTEAGEAR
ncbi:hypothetical protein [Actinoplanes flavus]|uniref:Uncharacterized protein n=1 Tax=Actinoplanes flavus TaxID=2820290 RepID=A0ABS3UEP9_9ACTN|nr:hypothetical protein [Actinoplanes flavus]MBO3736711.1 hypothetical protein [Actinoplanes flavus]